ncbi:MULTISPECIES: hypothetical protein [Streptomyces]|uniref:Integral membrane protein n=1 Tax=Streptomyces griseosporeus TaxID=1910 RepID=A0ABV3KUX3_STRGS|nr:hypothetical protein [Streptomyces actuosus]MBM4823459.1 hypothetical protein [Streptomyces actuosus]
MAEPSTTRPGRAPACGPAASPRRTSVPVLRTVSPEQRGAVWWLGWLVPMVAAHRLCTPTRRDRVVDPVMDRVLFWRTALGLLLTVGAWLAFGLIPPREIPGQFEQSFAYGFSAVQLVFYVAWFMVAMTPRGYRRAAAARWRGPVLAFVLTFTAFVVFRQTGLSAWPPHSPWSAACGLWLSMFGGYGGFLLIVNGARTADINDGLPAVLPVFSVLAFALPSLGDPMYDKVSMPVRLLLGLTGPVTLALLTRWQLRRLRTLHGVRLSDMWRRA